MSKSWLSVLILLMSLTACQLQDNTVLPTVAVLPSVTATFTATFTPTNTATATHTPTFTLSPTDPSTATATFTASATFTATASPTNTVPPTATVTLTPTLTPTETATLTPIPTRTPDAPTITVFQSNIQIGAAGSPVIFRWEASADSVRLEHIDNVGGVLEVFQVQPIDALTTNLPSSGDSATYQLVAVRGTSEVKRTIVISMRRPCSFDWGLNPAPRDTCAQGGVFPVQITYQPFLRGFMFRYLGGGLDKVCAVQFDRNLYSCFPYRDYTATPVPTPVPTFFAPASTISQVYYETLAIGGYWYDVIGWGTATFQSITTNAQMSDDGKLFLQTPQGIFGFDSQLSGVGQPVIRP